MYTSVNERLRDLVWKYYPPVYRLALATLHDTKASHRAALRTFARAALDMDHWRTTTTDRQRIFALALQVIRSEKHRLQGKPEPPASLNLTEMRLWQMVDGLGAREHELCLLCYLLEWNIPETAAILHVSQSAVRTQLDIFREKFSQILGSTPHPGAIEGKTREKSTVDQIRERKTKGFLSLDARVSDSLQKRWPVIQLTSTEVEQVIDQIDRLACEELARRQQFTPYKWLAFSIAGVILVATLLSWVVISWLAGSKTTLDETQPTTWRPEEVSSPLVKAKPLTWLSDSDTILLRLKEGPMLWKTLWIDVQIIDYGPQSYAGLPRAYRAQAWISQPDQSLELFGLLSEPPNSLYIVEKGKSIYINPILEQTSIKEREGDKFKKAARTELLSNDRLLALVFPGRATSGSADIGIEEGFVGKGAPIWINQDGTFEALKTERIAGRRALVTDWVNKENQREARLWLDVQTGLVLRMQEFGGTDFQTIVSESTATEIAYNQSNPPPWLAETLELREPDSSPKWMKSSGSQETSSPTPTYAAALVQRPSVFSESAPNDFDPTGSSLIFQFPMDPKIANSITNTAEIPSGLIADGYLLGVIKFGLPWVLRCDRSPDGQRVAFDTGTDGISPADDALQWFNLKEPQAIYKPLPGLRAIDFAFSPDSRRLAIFGFGEGQWDEGIYVLDIGTGEHEFLMSLASASSLVWSPDGEFLALIGAIETGDQLSLLIIHVGTAQIAYQEALSTKLSTETLEYEAFTDSPLASWGIEFPVEMGGMDECAMSPLKNR